MWTQMDSSDPVHGCQIMIWSAWHTEHLASSAAQRGDSATENLCDRVLSGELPDEVLVDVVATHAGYYCDMQRGGNLGWAVRS